MASLSVCDRLALIFPAASSHVTIGLPDRIFCTSIEQSGTALVESFDHSLLDRESRRRAFISSITMGTQCMFNLVSYKNTIERAIAVSFLQVSYPFHVNDIDTNSNHSTLSRDTA